MNWCDTHWAQLRKAVDDKGLGHLVSKSGEEAAARTTAHQAGAEDFDPLLGCWMQINMQMMEDLGGPYEECPMCILVKDQRPDLVENWIDGCTTSCREYCLVKGIIKEPSGDTQHGILH